MPLPLLASCYAPVPAQFAESTEIVPRHAVSLTVAASGAAATSFCSGCSTSGEFGLGGEGRVRFGIDGRQEIGASGFGAFVSGTGGGGVGYVAGGKLSYKIAVAPWFAIIAGAGALDVSSTAIFGGDLAMVFAPYTDSRGTQLYTAVRGSFGIPDARRAARRMDLAKASPFHSASRCTPTRTCACFSRAAHLSGSASCTTRARASATARGPLSAATRPWPCSSSSVEPC